MGKIELDHTGSGAGVTLSSDGTDLLLDGAAIGGGGGTALELYAENPSSPTAPSATGTNAVAIGSESVSSGLRSTALAKSRANGTDSFAAAIGDNSTAYGAYGVSSIALGGLARASNSTSTAIGYGSNASANGAFAIGQNAVATGTLSIALGWASSTTQMAASALGYNAVSAGTNATALTNSYASGTNSFAAAIANNSSSYGATGANSVAIGDRNKASGGYSVSLGRLNQSTASNSTSLGLYSVASSKYSLAVGYEASTRATPSISFSTGSYSGIAGQHQISMFVLRQRTTDGTSALLLADGATNGSIDDQIILPNNAAFSFHGTIVARQQASAGTASAAWKIEGLIRREGSAGTTVLVNSATTVLDNTPAWGMALSADITNGGLKIEVTGAAATNIAWNGNIHTSEVTY